MDEVNITRGQLRELAKQNEDVTIIGTNTDAQMILVERTKKRGDRGEAKWLMPHGRVRKEVDGAQSE